WPRPPPPCPNLHASNLHRRCLRARRVCWGVSIRWAPGSCWNLFRTLVVRGKVKLPARAGPSSRGTRLGSRGRRRQPVGQPEAYLLYSVQCTSYLPTVVPGNLPTLVR
ncbi:hypothetical protein BO71DRAFT_487974, partial [Aspergillus ellipticus CBS 707.79]